MTTYDAAISFLSPDEPLARSVVDRIRPRMGEIFAYYERQPELVGGDLLERFSRVFGHEARVVIVLYREGWGRTPYTAAEAEAIKKRGLTNAWRGIIFAKLDSFELPSWLPYTHAWHDFSAYGLEGLAAAIEHKVREAGGRVVDESLVEYAERIERREAWEKQRKTSSRQAESVAEAWRSVGEIFDKVEAIAMDIAKAAPALAVTIADRRREMATVYTHRSIVRLVHAQDSGNWITESGLKLMVGDRSEPPRYPSQTWTFELAPELEWRWKDDEGRLLTTAAVADETIRQLLRHHAGESDFSGGLLL